MGVFGSALAAAALLVPISASGPAAAATRPHVGWTTGSTATAGQAAPFSWNVKHLAKADKLVLQRQQGSKHVWRTVAKLPHKKHGSGRVPALTLGDYQLRIAVISKKGHHLVAQQARTLRVYGRVPFSQLFSSSSEGVYSTGSLAFSYYFWMTDYREGYGAVEVTGQNNHCNFISVDYVPGSRYGYDDSGYTGTLAILQGSRDAVATTTAFNQRGTTSAALVPGQPWTINLSQAGGQSALDFYLNGYAMCDSAKPIVWDEESLF